MTTVALATSAADAAALETLEQRHAELVGRLTALVDRLVNAVGEPGQDAATARAELVRWARLELLPVVRAETGTFHPVASARPATSLLVAGLRTGLEGVAELVDHLESGSDAVRVISAAGALRTLVELHVRTADEVLLPALAAAPDVSLGELLEHLEADLALAFEEADRAAADAEVEARAGGGHSCGCGGHDDEGDPELDARVVPHAIRHATIFGALDAVPKGGAMVLVAPHDPIPLLAQLEQRHPGGFAVEYLERGPETWRLRFARRAA